MEIIGIDVPLWVILILLMVLLYTFLMSRDFWTFRRMGIPGPTPRPIVGNMMAMVSEGFRAFDQKAIKKYGKVFGHFDVMCTNLVVADKEMLREILVKQFNNFSDRRTLDGFVGDLEQGLTNVKGEHWKHNRATITPTFSSGKLRQMIPLIQETCNTLVKTSRNAMKTGDNGQVEMRRLFAGFTMDVISSTAFGIQVDSQGNPDDLFVKHAKKMFDVSLTKPWMLLVLFFPALRPLLMKLGVCLFPKDSMAYFRKLTIQLLEERRRNRQTGRKDFLQLVIDAQEGKTETEDQDSDGEDSLPKQNKVLTFEEILGNSQLFFVAGYETTAITLTMNAYNLATNPECQDKLRKEIEEKIGSEDIDYENIKRLQYLDMCINETLRIYPPAMRMNRKCTKTTKVKDITIPAGMVVTVPIYAMHHDPEVWEKPDIFNPERFSASQRENHDPLDFLPFGYGPRICIGMRLALMEAKMATAYLVRNFRLCVSDKTDIPPKLEDKNILKPTHLWLKLEEIHRTKRLNGQTLQEYILIRQDQGTQRLNGQTLQEYILIRQDHGTQRLNGQTLQEYILIRQDHGTHRLNASTEGRNHQVASTKGCFIRELLPKDGSIRELLPKDGSIRELLPKDGSIRELLPKDGSIIKLDGSAFNSFAQF
ncbi:cytochrome P450 3A8-like [Ylistrum balloti]|uniref:cytochrome P450 3A8-like n=1 Tax=Ylistrum balloti TaxID=509963 RepID=UPI0029059F6C|nr:cytochrome P450 3A8-like [Ylistrum balloti]